MNADSADTRYPHLDLDDLIAGAAGQPLRDRAKDHLANCEDCQRETNRWNLVADGVRGLVADSSETPPPLWSQDAPQHVGRPWRRAIEVVAGVAAVLVLLVGIGVLTGTVHVYLSGRHGGTVLTSVGGCTQLEQADGTLEQVNGSTLVVQTASGQLVTVTTTASTFVSASGPLLGYISDGASVMVRGYSSNGTLDAAIVTVGQPFSAVNPSGFVPVQGTVSDVSTAGFSLLTSSGARVRVATSPATLVIVPDANPGQLQAGSPIFAVGNAEPDGILSATAVAAVTQLPHGRLNASVKVKDCSPSSIVEALGAISSAPASAR
jgi:Domain of unknown function (DUF5666)